MIDDPLQDNASESSGDPQGTAESPPGESPLMALRDADGAEILTLSRDGTVWFAPGSSLDEMSRRFWQAVAGQQGVLEELRAALSVYLCGPMDGLPNGNIPTFRSAAKILQQGGYQVVDPTELSFNRFDTAESTLRSRLTALLTCNAVALLPGWHNSFACQLEVENAAACGMTVAPIDFWLVEPSK